MKTMNISVTTEQYEAINTLVKEKGYANRSELFRSLVRIVVRKPEVLPDSIMEFANPPTRDKNKILKAFRATGKYSEAFLKDLEEGMENSDYFE